SGRGERLVEPRGVPAARLGDVVAATAATPDELSRLADHLGCREAALDHLAAEARHDGDLAAGRAAEDDGGLPGTRLDPVGEVEERALIGVVRPADEHGDARDLVPRGRDLLGPLGEVGRAGLAGPLLQLPQPILELARGAERVLLGAEDAADLAERARARAEPVDRGRSGERLDPADVRGARALGGDREDADRGRVGDMGSPAELARDVLDLDHADPVAVLLAEQRHRTETLSLHPRHLERPHRMALLDPLVDAVADVAQLLASQRGPVGEVEAELVRPDGRAGLADVATEPLPQGRVEQVRRGVVAHRREAGDVVDLGLDAGPWLQAVRPLQLERLVLADPVDVGDPGAAGLPTDLA